MAHELDFSKGRAAIFTVRKPAWHEEGIVLPDAPTVEQAIVAAGLDFEVQKRPTYREVTQPDGTTAMEPNRAAYVTVRTDTGAELGAVGPQYRPLLVVNNHNGRRNLVIMETPIRVVCANTQGMALQPVDLDGEEGKVQNTARAVLIRHVGDVEVKATQAAMDLFGALIERYEVVAKQYRLLKQTYLDVAAFERLVLDTAAPDPRKSPRFNPDAKLAHLVVERAEKRRAALTRLWDEGDGHTGDRSAWEAYCAVTQALDHDKELWPVRDGAWRTASLLDGALAETKNHVLDRLVRHANTQA